MKLPPPPHTQNSVQSTALNSPYNNNNSHQQSSASPQLKTYQPKQKNSGLGIAALVLSILGCTFIIGAILAIIDLVKKDGKKKTCSIIALVICGLWLIISLINAAGDNDSSTRQTTTSATSTMQDTESKESPLDSEESQSTEENGSKASETIEKTTAPKISKDDFIASCEEIPYKTLARNPENYIGEHIKLTVKVSQIMQGGFFDSGEYYRVYTNDEYGLWLGDEYFMSDGREDKDMKILEDDILTVYAEFDGTQTVERALTGTKEDIVSIKAIYIDLEEAENGYTDSTATAESDDSQYDGLTAGQTNALKSAKSYLDFSAFSYQGLIEQLEYEEYSHEDAAFAADNCGADWNEQAARSAKSYLEYSSFSKDGLIEQLEYEGFTHEQAIYGVEQNGY